MSTCLGNNSGRNIHDKSHNKQKKEFLGRGCREECVRLHDGDAEQET
jgi:hypothetical protein